MENRKLASVPFYCFESIQARAEKAHRRLLTALFVSMALNVACIATVAKKIV